MYRKVRVRLSVMIVRWLLTPEAMREIDKAIFADLDRHRAEIVDA